MCNGSTAFLWSSVSTTRCLFPLYSSLTALFIEDEDYVLVSPRVVGPKLSKQIRKKIVTALVTRLSSLNAATKADLVPVKRAEQLLDACSIESWGRLRALWGGDTMLASELVLRESHDRRDATFMKVCEPVCARPLVLTSPHHTAVYSVRRWKRKINDKEDELQADSILWTIAVHAPSSCPRDSRSRFHSAYTDCAGRHRPM